MAKDIIAKSKAFSINALLNNPKIYQSVVDAMQAPLGSTKRDKARSLLSSVGTLSRNRFSQGEPEGEGGYGPKYDGKGGGLDFTNPNLGNTLYGASSSQDSFSGLGSNQNIIGASPTLDSSGVRGLDNPPAGFNFLTGYDKPKISSGNDLSGLNIMGEQKSDPTFVGGTKGAGIPDDAAIRNAGFYQDPGMTLPTVPGDSSGLFSIQGSDVGIPGLNIQGTPSWLGNTDDEGKAGVRSGSIVVDSPYQLAPGVTMAQASDPSNFGAFWVKKDDPNGQRFLRYSTGANGEHLDLLGLDPYKMALALPEDELFARMTDAQREIAKRLGWTSSGQQMAVAGPDGRYLFIPDSKDIADAKAKGLFWHYDPNSADGWKLESDPAAAAAQAGEENAINEILGTMEEFAALGQYGRDGLDSWWNEIKDTITNPETREAMYDIYQLASNVPSPELLLRRVMNDKKVLAHILGIPESEVPTGISLAQQKADITDAAKQAYKVDEIEAQLWQQLRAGMSMSTALPGYVREKDTYLKQIKDIRRDASDKMKYMDMSNPYIQQKMQNYMSYLDVSSGRVNDRYSRFLQNASAEQENNIAVMQKQLELNAGLAQGVVDSKYGIVESEYNEYKSAIEGWTNTLLSLNDKYNETVVWNQDRAKVDSDIMKNLAGSTTEDKPLTTTQHKYLNEILANSDVYSLADMARATGSMGITAFQMSQLLADSTKSTLSATNENTYAIEANKFKSGLSDDVASGYIDQTTALDLSNQIGYGVKDSIVNYLTDQEDKIEEVRDAIKWLSKLDFDELDDEEKMQKFERKFDRLSAPVAQDIFKSYSTYKQKTGEEPLYPDDDASLIEQIGRDIGGLYRGLNAFQ